ncbi:hypothetical protein M413DRAFT_412540 [Hebeloma cylindrosporum]|uniref:Uncharacterized protein n=1 Tax=Hebeloma cylindrosporum TaxID=76867 RepID=A0A0C3CAD3_HEBCY|nr:hypothetical protein M413DRAFT_412540 [Hebeloma cylindrosporum h7]
MAIVANPRGRRIKIFQTRDPYIGWDDKQKLFDRTLLQIIASGEVTFGTDGIIYDEELSAGIGHPEECFCIIGSKSIGFMMDSLSISDIVEQDGILYDAEQRPYMIVCECLDVKHASKRLTKRRNAAERAEMIASMTAPVVRAWKYVKSRISTGAVSRHSDSDLIKA